MTIELRPTVLLVEDDFTTAQLCQRLMENEPIKLERVNTGATALRYLQHTTPAVILLDLDRPNMHGMEIIKYLKQHRLNCAILVVTKSIEAVVNVMHYRITDFIEKPIQAAQLIATLHQALKGQQSNYPFNTQPPQKIQQYHQFIGDSPPMREIYQTIDMVAKTDVTVLIAGETGTGKELCAHAIHQESLRRDKPYIVFNCAAIPGDLMESQLFGHVKGAFTGASKNRVGAAAQANGGTLFLDEIGEMDLELQGKLLRFVETKDFHKVGSDQLETVDIRFLWATHRYLPTEIKAGRFREDLYYRLKTILIQLPPLRDRGDDVLLLAQAFLAKYSQSEKKFNNGFDQRAEKLLLHYKWPGNVRQLQKCIERLVLLNEGEKVTSQMLLAALADEPLQTEDTTTHPPQPALLNPAMPIPATSQHSHKPIRPLWQTERETILDAIKYCHGNVVKAAESLQISKSYIYKKLKQWKEEDKKYQAGKKRRKNVISNA